jgi:hypothetical protein
METTPPLHLQVQSAHTLSAETCADCGREHLMGEHVEVRRADISVAWAGCLDCWRIRTNPQMIAERF